MRRRVPGQLSGGKRDPDTTDLLIVLKSFSYQSHYPFFWFMTHYQSDMFDTLKF